MNAARPVPSCQLRSWHSARTRAPGLQPIPTLCSGGPRMGTWHGCPLVTMHHLDLGLRPALREPKVLWTQGGPSEWLHTPGPCSLAGMAIHLLICPKSPGALDMVSCWLLARHPPWYPACPLGQQPGSVHLGGVEGGWGWWDSGFPEGGEEEVLGLAPQFGGVNFPQDPGGKGYPLAPCPPHSVSGIWGLCLLCGNLIPSGLQVQFPKGVSISFPS